MKSRNLPDCWGLPQDTKNVYFPKVYCHNSPVNPQCHHQSEGDLSATHFFSGGHICSAEFLRGSAGWSLHQAGHGRRCWVQDARSKVEHLLFGVLNASNSPVGM